MSEHSLPAGAREALAAAARAAGAPHGRPPDPTALVELSAVLEALSATEVEALALAVGLLSRRTWAEHRVRLPARPAGVGTDGVSSRTT